MDIFTTLCTKHATKSRTTLRDEGTGRKVAFKRYVESNDPATVAAAAEDTGEVTLSVPKAACGKAVKTGQATVVGKFGAVACLDISGEEAAAKATLAEAIAAEKAAIADAATKRAQAALPAPSGNAPTNGTKAKP